MQEARGSGGRSAELRVWLLVTALIVGTGAWSGCRIQRGGSAPEEPAVAPPRAGEGGGPQAGPAVETAAEPQSTPPPSSASVSAQSPASPPAAQGGDSSKPSMDAGVAPPTRAASAGASPRPAGSSAAQSGVADGCRRTVSRDGCNPITNEGCAQELGLQCDVDLASTELRGVCVFSAPSPDGSTCLNLPPTESCPPGQTCVDFSECRKVCLCDDDCDAGDCCASALGSSGFKTCGDC
jgi:hypothetical protein